MIRVIGLNPDDPILLDTGIDLCTLDRADFRAAVDGSPTFKDQLIRVFTQRGA